MPTTSACTRFDLTIPLADWGTTKDYLHPLEVGSATTIPATTGTCVLEAVWVLDSLGVYHPELPSVISVVNPGPKDGVVRLEGRDNSVLYLSLGITPVSYVARIYVQRENTLVLPGLMRQDPYPTPIGSAMWSYSGGGPTPPAGPTYSCDASVAVGEIVYISAAGAVAKAQAIVACPDGVGIVVSKPTAITCQILGYGDLAGAYAGLTPGATYFVSEATPGAITSAPPSGVGEKVQRAGTAISATDLHISVDPMAVDL